MGFQISTFRIGENRAIPFKWAKCFSVTSSNVFVFGRFLEFLNIKVFYEILLLIISVRMVLYRITRALNPCRIELTINVDYGEDSVET